SPLLSVTSIDFWTVSMLTTAGSTRRAISAKEAERASGARAICIPSWATVGLPERIAPIPIPATRHATARAAIQILSFRKIVRSWSVILDFERSNIAHHLRNNRNRCALGDTFADSASMRAQGKG